MTPRPRGDSSGAGWSASLSRPLTPSQRRRIQLHLLLIPVYAWTVFVWAAYAIDISPSGRLDRSGHIKGHDFAHFYVLGQIAGDRAPADLYSYEAQAARTDRLVPEYENRFLPVHGPQVALFFAPFARLPYTLALALWLGLCAAIYGASAIALWRATPALRRYGWVAALLVLGNPGFYALIAAGQTSAVALAWFTLAYLALVRGRPWLAGLALGALAYKPALALVLPFAVLYARQWRILFGALVSIALQAGSAWAYFGTDAMAGYLGNISRAANALALLEARPWLMHSLRPFFSLLIPWPSIAWAAYVATAAFAIVVATRTWRSAAPLELRYAVLLVATVLVDPHVYSYELVVLVPAFVLAASWAIERAEAAKPVGIVLYLCYILPMFDDLTRLTRVQWSVVALATLLIQLARSSGPRAAHHAGRG